MPDQPLRSGGGVARRLLLRLAAASLALTFAACSGGSLSSGVPDDLGGVPSDEVIPTFPPDDLATGTAACLDAPTMAIIDQLRAPGADVPAVLAANEEALIEGLEDLESADPRTMAWRDALLDALAADDMTAAAAQVAVLVAGDLTITPC